MKSGSLLPTPGWIVQLTGHDFDWSSWERSLKPPFDPWCERIPQGESSLWALRSRSFDHAQSAGEVRERAVPLIQQLNGALSVLVGAEPLTFQAVGRIADKGKIGLTPFPKPGKITIRGGTAINSLEMKDAKEPSAAQRWIEAAEKDDFKADMLVFAGRADNWYDIYKTIELAECLYGSEHKLRKLLGDSANACKNMRTTANCYRHRPNHPKYPPPSVPTELTEAKPLLSLIVRAARCTDGLSFRFGPLGDIQGEILLFAGVSLGA